MLTAKCCTSQGAECATTSARRAASCKDVGAAVADNVNDTLTVAVIAADGIRLGVKVGRSVGDIFGLEVGHKIAVGGDEGCSKGDHEGGSDGENVIREGAGDGAKVGDRTHRSRAGTFRSPAPSIPL